MYIPKRYGESKISKCPFCGKDAFSQNKQKIPTCKEHKETTFDNVKCLCGSWLDMREGKFGVFFTCINCGAMNIKKVLEIATMTRQKEAKIHETRQQEKMQIAAKPVSYNEKKEVTIRSDDPDFF